MAETLSVEALLRWYAEAGVDECVGERPRDRFAESAAAPPPPTTAPAPAPPPPPPPPAAAGLTAALSTAARLAQAAGDLEALREALEAFEGYPLKGAARSTVFGEGVANPAVMVIGEAPGADEDRLGRPFVGASGRLLDRMLASVGLDRARNVYITNVLPWRPPLNRKPSPAEAALLQPFLRRHIALVAPRALLLLGGSAAAAVLDAADPITRLRGRGLEVPGGDGAAPLPAVATYHPAFLLRTPGRKRDAWLDLLLLAKSLDPPA